MNSKFDIGPLSSGLRVGLFGGSFNPPHQGHIQLSREALKRFDLDRVIWLVSPGNPLKTAQPAALDLRMKACRRLILHPAVSVSGCEAEMGTRFTAESLDILSRCFPLVRFVWLMGADNLVQFNQWRDWRKIAALMPIGILARPGHRLAARNSVSARVYREKRLPDKESRLLATKPAPCWCFANMPLREESSTALRQMSLR